VPLGEIFSQTALMALAGATGILGSLGYNALAGYLGAMRQLLEAVEGKEKAEG